MDRWKAEQGRGREKRKIRRGKSQKKEDADARKGRKVAKHCVFPMIWGPGGSKSRLAKAAGAEPAGQMRDLKKNCTPLWRKAHFEVQMHKTHHGRTTFGSWDVEEVHAVVARSTFPSQNVQNTSAPDHFWKLRCRKSARRCGAKHISKSKCTKHTRFGPLLEVQMSKKCTPLWREAHFQVKMYKAPHVRATFGGSDVEKVHAVVARSTFRSQNVKNTRVSDHFWRFRFRFASLHYIIYTTLHYTPVHYTTLHYITLHYTTFHHTSLHYTPLHYTTTKTTQLHSTRLHHTPLHYITLQHTTLHYTTLRYLPLHFTTLHYTPLHYKYNYNYTTTLHYTPLDSTTLNYTTLHYTTLHYTTWHYTTLHYTTLHYITLHYTTFHYTSLHYSTLHSTTLQLQLQLHNYSPLHSTTLHYTQLHYTTLHYTTLHYTTLHYTTFHYTPLH